MFKKTKRNPFQTWKGLGEFSQALNKQLNIHETIPSFVLSSQHRIGLPQRSGCRELSRFDINQIENQKENNCDKKNHHFIYVYFNRSVCRL